MCGIEIDGDAYWIQKGQSNEVNSIVVSVVEPVPVHAQLQDVDMCRVNIGHSDITIKDGSEVNVNGVDVDGSKTYIAETGGKWTGLNISWIPDDDIYLYEEEEIIDPVLGNFKFIFGGSNKDTETINIETEGDEDTQISFLNNDHMEVNIPLFFNSTNVLLGSYSNERMYQEGDICNKSQTSIKDCEKSYFFVVTPGKEVHILKIFHIDTLHNEIDLQDLTYNRMYSKKSYIDSATTETGFGLGRIGALGMIIDEANGMINFTNIKYNDAETSNGMLITILHNGINVSFSMLEEQHDETKDYNTNITAVIYPDLENDEIAISRPTDKTVQYSTLMGNLYAGAYAGYGILGGQSDSYYAVRLEAGLLGGTAKAVYNTSSLLLSCGWLDQYDDNHDVKLASTLKTGVLYDQDQKDFASIMYSDEEPTQDVFIAPSDSKLTVSEELQSISIKRIHGAGKIASEVKGKEKTQNIISVGGPCTNPVSAMLMGLEYPSCGSNSTINEGTGIIRSYLNEGNIGIVVAGYDSKGTRAAARALARYKDFALDGDSLEVIYKSLDDFSVRAPIVQAEDPAVASAGKNASVSEEIPASSCIGTNPAKAASASRISKFSITVVSNTDIEVTMSGTKGIVKFSPDKVFKSQLGVDWVRRKIHVLKGACSSPGEEVFFASAEWRDGDRIIEKEIIVPEPGCYCLYADNNDLEIDDAHISFEGTDKSVLDFRA
jgi:hypothetical protein